MSTAIDPRALTQLLDMAGGDRSFVVEIIDDYLADSAALLATLREASGDDLRRAAHSLKSTSASLGAGRLAALSAQIEQAGAADPGVIAEAEREHAAVRAGLEEQREAFS
jgi:HPt (histidine-containing phosphotransfer) domain-containing protein